MHFLPLNNGHVFVFHQQIHRCLWEILKMIQDDYCIMMADGQSLDMTSVADLMDGRLVHTLCSLALDEIPEGFK